MAQLDELCYSKSTGVLSVCVCVCACLHLFLCLSFSALLLSCSLFFLLSFLLSFLLAFFLSFFLSFLLSFFLSVSASLFLSCCSSSFPLIPSCFLSPSLCAALPMRYGFRVCGLGLAWHVITAIGSTHVFICWLGSFPLPLLNWLRSFPLPRTGKETYLCLHC